MQVQDIQIKTHDIAIKYTTDNAQDIVDYIKKHCHRGWRILEV